MVNLLSDIGYAQLNFLLRRFDYLFIIFISMIHFPIFCLRKVM